MHCTLKQKIQSGGGLVFIRGALGNCILESFAKAREVAFPFASDCTAPLRIYREIDGAAPASLVQREGKICLLAMAELDLFGL